jgi:two-component system, LytTR family, sensor kinase
MILRRWKFWLALLLAATLVGLLEGAQVYTGASAMGRPVAWARALGSTMPSWYVLVAIMPAILWLSRRFPLEPGRWPRSLAVHAAAAVAFAIIHITLASWLSDYVLHRGADPAWSFGMNLSRLFTIYFVVELFTYFALVGAYHAFEYARLLRQRDREAADLALLATRLEADLAQASLDSLRMQLNPHFLFNTLNAVSVLALKGESQAVVRMLTLLSDLLRMTLDSRDQVVSLREELAFLDRYIEIERIRFEDRLTLERDIDPDALTAEVPSLLLQPLVENAIGHGISRRAGPGTVRIEAGIRDGEVLELRVLDTGPGIAPGRLPGGGWPSNGSVEAGSVEAGAGGSGVGITNTRSRLRQLYGDRHELAFHDRPEGGACVTVRLPLRFFSSEPVRRAGAGGVPVAHGARPV